MEVMTGLMPACLERASTHSSWLMRKTRHCSIKCCTCKPSQGESSISRVGGAAVEQEAEASPAADYRVKIRSGGLAHQDQGERKRQKTGEIRNQSGEGLFGGRRRRAGEIRKGNHMMYIWSRFKGEGTLEWARDHVED